MSRWDDPDEVFFRPERDPSEVVRDELAKIGFDWDNPQAKIGGAIEEAPEVIERRRQEAAERLRRQDLLFGTYPGCTLGAPPPFEPADDTDRPD